MRSDKEGTAAAHIALVVGSAVVLMGAAIAAMIIAGSY